MIWLRFLMPRVWRQWVPCDCEGCEIDSPDAHFEVLTINFEWLGGGITVTDRHTVRFKAAARP